MIDISPPEMQGNIQKIPPRELIKEKIEEMEKAPAKPTKAPLGKPGFAALKNTEMKDNTKPNHSGVPRKSMGTTLLGLIVAFILIFVVGLFAYLGFSQSRTLLTRVTQLQENLATSSVETTKTLEAKVGTIEKDLADFKKITGDKEKELETKLSQIVPENFADKARVEKVETVLKTVDSDKDGLTDFDEVTVYSTNPNLKDTDKDGFDDKSEIDGGYNPSGPGKLTKSFTPITEETQVRQVKAYNSAYDPAQIEVQIKKPVKIIVTSLDSEHTFTIDALNISTVIKAGGTEIIEFTPETASEYTFYSNILADKEKGMTGKLIVK